jgi:adenylate kinase family enzyme
MKITIIGSSGGGKSTLARKISQTFDIPRLEIDRIWFKYDGHKNLNGTPQQKETVSQKIESDLHAFLLVNDNWVIDGTYSKLQPLIAGQADTVILIKRPLLQRIWGHIIRVLRGTDRHPEVTMLQDLNFTKIIFRRWRNKEDAKLDEFAKTYHEKLVVLKSFKEIDTYFHSLSKSS